MKRSLLTLSVTSTLASLALCGVEPVIAQQSDVELPEYTAEQRWQRLANGAVWWQAAMLAFGKQQGMTPEEIGAWVGDFFSQGWLGGQEAAPFAVAMNRNHMSWPGASAEVLASTPTTVQVRFNRPWEDVIGPDRRLGGSTTGEFQAMQRATNMAVADWVGIDVAWDEQEESDVLTLRTEYGPIQASDDIRWARGAYLSWNSFFNLLELRMQSGMTARDVGIANGELYGPGWTATTPWQLFRGMLWNAMGDPNTDCEVLSASPSEVRARCAIAYTAERIGQSSAYFDVTLDDVLESGRAFAESVAEQLGMRWEESWDDAYRTIRVTMR
ncbi:MAG TPA: hypothetical protein VLA36_16430 [Longimicrobiales bacterium]|nr:hypothetical protein [Longimicrobiales bacterium]